MPFLRKPQLQPVKGIDLSTPSTYLGDGNNYPQNLQLFRGDLKKRDGRSFMGDVSLGAQKILHLATFELTTGSIRLIRHTKTNVQKFNPNSRKWNDITGVDTQGGELDIPSSCVVTESDLYLFCDGVGPIRKYDDGVATATLGGNPPLAKCIEYITPYVLIGNLTDSGLAIPSKIQWCNTGLPEVWSGGNSGSQLLSDEPSAIRAIKKMRDYGFAYKEKSVYRGSKVSSAAVFNFGGPFSSGKGLYSPRAISDTGDAHYYMGLNDFHFNDGVRITDIGGPIREYLFNRLNRSRNVTCHSLHVEYYKEIWFFVTVTGQSWPTEVWKYNYAYDFWYFDTVVNCITAANYKQTKSRTWDEAVGTWDQQITTWDDQQGTAEAPIQIFGFDSGFCGQLDSSIITDMGQPINSLLDTKDFTGLVHNGIEYDTRWLQFDAWASGETLKLSYSTDYGATWKFIKEKPLKGSVEKITFFFDIIAKHIRFRLQAEGPTSRLTLRAFTPYFLGDAEDPAK